MNLGRKEPSYETKAAPASPSKPRITYPTFTIEKPVGGAGYKYGDVFTATVRLRVQNVEHGKSYPGSDPRHRCTLEVLSMEPVRRPKKGLPS